jgi:hypothetical protein
MIKMRVVSTTRIFVRQIGIYRAGARNAKGEMQSAKLGFIAHLPVMP